MKKTFLLLFTLLFYLNSYAQEDFREGFCITNAHDTIPGFINYEEGIGSMKRFKFKKQAQDNAYYFYPADVVAFGFEGDKRFESAMIDGKSSKVFMEVLVKGLASLYRYNGRFFIKKEDSFRELELVEREVQRKGRTYKAPAKAHIGILNYLMFDCPDIQGQINSVKVIEKSLTKLFIKYNQCMGEEPKVYKEQKPWSEVSFEPALGLISSSIDKISWGSNLVNREVTRGVAKNLFRPFGGVTADISSPRIVESLSVQLGVFYLQSQYYSPTEPDRNTTEIEIQELKFPFSIRYTLKANKVNWYANPGIAYSRFISDNRNLVDSRSFTTVSNQFGIWGGFGAQTKVYKNLNGFFEFRYEHTSSLVKRGNQSGFKLHINHFYTFIGIKF